MRAGDPGVEHRKRRLRRETFGVLAHGQRVGGNGHVQRQVALGPDRRTACGVADLALHRNRLKARQKAVYAADVDHWGHADVVGARAILYGGLDHPAVVLMHAEQPPLALQREVGVLQVLFLHLAAAGKAAGGQHDSPGMDEVIPAVHHAMGLRADNHAVLDDQVIGFGLQHVGAAQLHEVFHALGEEALRQLLAAGDGRIGRPGIARKAAGRVELEAVLGQPVVGVAALVQEQAHHLRLRLLLAGVVGGVLQPRLMQSLLINQVVASLFGDDFLCGWIGPFRNLCRHLTGHVDGHRAAGQHGVAAELGRLVDGKNIQAMLRRAERSSHAGAAQAHDQHVGGQLLSLVHLGNAVIERLHVLRVSACGGDRFHQCCFRRLPDAVAGGRRAADRVHGHGLVFQHPGHEGVHHRLHHRLGVGDVLLIDDDVLDLVLTDRHGDCHRLADAKADALTDIFAGLHANRSLLADALCLINAILRRKEDRLAGKGSAGNAVHIRALGLQDGCGQRFDSLASHAVRLRVPGNLHIGDPAVIERHCYGDIPAKAGLCRFIRPRLVSRFRNSTCRQHAKSKHTAQYPLKHRSFSPFLI